MKTKWVFLLVVLAFFCSIQLAAGQVRPIRNKTSTSNGVNFRKIIVDETFRAEGVAVGDVNHDGKTDILAGDVWYAAPDWKMHELRPIGQYDGSKGYSNCFANFAQDVNGDGWVDSIIIGLPDGPCLWYENPKNKPGHWKQRMVVNSACNETPIFVDLLGNGNPVLIFAVRPKGLMAWFSVPNDLDGLWDMHTFAAGPDAPGTKMYSHGLGAGDVNGDGRNNVLIKEGWWEAPEDRTEGNWKFHPANLGPDCADILVYDVDGDGDSDVITSSAHNYGIWWFEQLAPADGSTFKQHVISEKYSQPHAIRLVDINGDGIKDLVTGKRHFAHMGKDPGGKDPAMLYWFELRRPQNGKVEFIMHIIDNDSGVGTQFEVIDLNGDGRPDIVTSNKKGVHVFLQRRQKASRRER
ncbi:MAG TPA: VCBS repeat-containing protein [Sedimentisphaerales bacterium]|nr:VCBS repeat-containing protein [Sedimentisphaerales bacterium]